MLKDQAARLRAVVVTATIVAAGAGIAGGDLAAQRSSAVPARPDDRTIVHVLNRIGFGPRAGDVERVREIGLAAYIDRQLHPERLADSGMDARLARFETLRLTSRELTEKYIVPVELERRQLQRERAANPDPAMAGEPRPPAPLPPQMRGAAMRGPQLIVAELSQQKILRAAFSERQLEEVMVDFWFNHFNVFAGKGADRNYLTEHERDVIRPRALGSFRDLLEATAQSPAMLFYLDNWMSADPNADLRPGRAGLGGRAGQPPRRPGRAGILPSGRRPGQPPGALQRRQRGLNENYARELMELHTLGVDGGYTQKDVVEVARAFTGWTIDQPRMGGGFRFDPRIHDDGEKVVLGHRIKSGGGRSDGEQVLDILAKHPSTARFIATKLARRFVADEPPKALVDRAAARFRASSGDIREVVRTIVTSPEFFAPGAYRAKVKTPFEFVVSAVRASGAEVFDAMPLVQTLRTLGMAPYMAQPPTGYADTADAWVNTGALLGRMNFAVMFVSNRMRGTSIDLARLARGADMAATREALVETMLNGDVSDATRATLEKATAVSQVAALTLGSPEFQRR
jgi:uncharacterized protein (DUF1800 family)